MTTEQRVGYVALGAMFVALVALIVGLVWGLS